MEKQIKLFVGTPMFGSMCYGAYANSCINLVSVLAKEGIHVMFFHLYNDALVARARNTIVDQFLETDCTHLLFIDADIQFRAEDIPPLLKTDEPVVGAAYAKKAINWKKVVHVVKEIPSINPHDIEKFAGDYVFNAKQPIQDIHQLYEVEEIGAGFLLIRRDVFSQLAKSFPELEYYDNEGKSHCCFFPTLIDNHGSATGGGSNRYLSEDYAFCALWKKLGGKIMMAPWVALKHIGTFSFTCDLPFVYQTCSTTTNLKN
jgi:hypothetical protein